MRRKSRTFCSKLGQIPGFAGAGGRARPMWSTAAMLNWLVIGIGDIARKRVLPAIEAEPRSRLHALLTRDVRKAEAYAGVVAFTDLNEALRDDKIDAVYVASPVALHAEQTIAFLRAGRHVRKPVAMNFAQAETMPRRRGDGRCWVAYFRRLYPLVRAKELIAQG